MTDQLKAALVRASWQAALVFITVLGGGWLVTDQAVDDTADSVAVTTTAPAETTAPTDTDGTTTTTEAGSATPPSDVPDDPDTSLQVLLAGVASVLVLAFRGAAEGLYDTKRQRDQNVKKGDVKNAPADGTAHTAAPILWVQLKDFGADHFGVLDVHLTDDGDTEFFVSTGDDDEPQWRDRDAISSIRHGAKPEPDA